MRIVAGCVYQTIRCNYTESACIAMQSRVGAHVVPGSGKIVKLLDNYRVQPRVLVRVCVRVRYEYTGYNNTGYTGAGDLV